MLFTDFRFAYPYLLLVLAVVIVIAALIVRFIKKPIVYSYSMAQQLFDHQLATTHWPTIFLFMFRIALLIMLAIISARPQSCDVVSKTHLDGVDIMITLDVSGSMDVQDSESDRRSRLQIAKDEALLFSKKRHDDAIGLVLFAQDAISRCPLTHDKRVISEIIQTVELGLINPGGTHLSSALVTAANRLKNSKAKSKIIILLTDGAPSDGDLQPEVAIEIAQQLGIKVYTIGIGSDQIFTCMTDRGLIYIPPVNKVLLETIAKQTGGRFFRANNAQDMRAIYTTIDKLEKTQYEIENVTHYYDLYVTLAWVILLCMIIELILSTFVWFRI